MNKEQVIELTLNEIGVQHHLLGRKYIAEGIRLIDEDASILQAVTKELYPAIARKFKTTGSRVERAIRHAIERTDVQIPIDVYEKIFGNTVDMRKAKLVNSHFLAAVQTYISTWKTYE